MSFELKNNIFTPFTNFSINNVLIFSKSIKQNWKHLHTLVHIIKNNGLVVSPTRISLFQNNIRFLVQNIFINKSLQILDKIKYKNQLHRFPESLNYISDYYKNFRIICKSHYQRLKENSPLWSNQHTEIIRHVQILTCLRERQCNNEDNEYYEDNESR
jgi:hypothetical protein